MRVFVRVNRLGIFWESTIVAFAPPVGKKRSDLPVGQSGCYWLLSLTCVCNVIDCYVFAPSFDSV